MGLRERLIASVTDIRARGQRLVQLNLELLTSELKEKGRRFAAAAGLFVGAGLLALYGFGFALATITAALALVLPWWASLLIVTAVLFLVVAIMILVGRSLLEKAKNPAPEAAIAEAKATADLVKAQVRETATGLGRQRRTQAKDRGRSDGSRRRAGVGGRAVLGRGLVRGSAAGRRSPAGSAAGRRSPAGSAAGEPGAGRPAFRDATRRGIEGLMSDATPGDAAKAPARPPNEIIADIRQERAALSGTFDSLRTDLGEAVEVGKEKGKEVGKKAAVVGSAVAASLTAAGAAALLLRRRRTGG